MTKIQISRYIEFLACLAFVAWLASEPSWEPGIGLLVSLFALVGSEIAFIRQQNSSKLNSPKPAVHDRKLYTKISSLLTSQGVMRFVRDHPMGSSFSRKRLENLEEFSFDFKGPEFTFLDDEMEDLRAKLYLAVEEYLNLIYKNTFYVKGQVGDFVNVPDELAENNYEKYERVIKDIHSSGDRVLEAHRAFIDKGKSWELGETGQHVDVTAGGWGRT